MVSLIKHWPFILPFFRERTFPGEEGRLRFALPVDVDHPIYESTDEEQHVDFAARWSHNVGVWDLGVSYFRGTSRDPRFLPGVNSQLQPVLVPFYEQISQPGFDAQATLDSWLWKLETIRRSGQGEAYYAATGGLEYTFYGVFDSVADVGLVMEYLWDDRGSRALTPFEDDLFMGLRLTLNDAQSTEALIGVIQDMDDDEHVLSIEASRRIGSQWKLLVEARSYRNTIPNSLLHSLRHDDYLQFDLEYHF